MNIRIKKSVKKLFFYSILIIPLIILLLILIYSFYEINKINNINHDNIYHHLNSYLQSKQGTSFPIELTKEYVNESKNNLNTSINIFMFGASSLVISNNSYSKNKSFPEFLEKKFLNNYSHIKIHNFGVCGIDSFSIKKRLVDSLNKTEIKPEIIIFYMGHNDYTTAYDHVINNYYNSFDYFLKVSYFFSKKEYKYYWFYDLKRAILLKLLQKINLVNIDNEDYNRYNSQILDYFKKNINDIINITSSNNIPIIFITPIGNLHAEPYGAINKVTYNYEKGLDSDNYNESIYYLKKARDAEILTADIRAKEKLIKYIRNIKYNDVYIYDLEKQLMNEKFGFSYEEFTDYFHFNEKTHKQIASHIYDFIFENNKIINKLKLNST